MKTHKIPSVKNQSQTVCVRNTAHILVLTLIKKPVFNNEMNCTSYDI